MESKELHLKETDPAVVQDEKQNADSKKKEDLE